MVLLSIGFTTGCFPARVFVLMNCGFWSGSVSIVGLCGGVSVLVGSMALGGFHNCEDRAAILFSGLAAFINHGSVKGSAVLRTLSVFFGRKGKYVSLSGRSVGGHTSGRNSSRMVVTMRFFGLPSDLIVSRDGEAALTTRCLLARSGALGVIGECPGTKERGICVQTGRPAGTIYYSLLDGGVDSLGTVLGQRGVRYRSRAEGTMVHTTV